MDQMAIPDAAHKREPHKDPKRFSKTPRYVHISEQGVASVHHLVMHASFRLE